MADKPKEKEAPKPNAYEGLIILGVFVVIGYFIFKFFSYFPNVDTFNAYMMNGSGGSSGWYSQFLSIGQIFVSIYSKAATILSALFVLMIAYAYIRHREIRHNEKKQDQALLAVNVTSNDSKTNSKWEKIVIHANSTNPAEWRLSILEADVLLEELLDSMHFVGNTLGDKLKGAEVASFKTIQSAWEAHKIRNAIAHEGADFLVSQREAKRVIGLFEQVFKEFDFI